MTLKYNNNGNVCVLVGTLSPVNTKGFLRDNNNNSNKNDNSYNNKKLKQRQLLVFLNKIQTYKRLKRTLV